MCSMFQGDSSLAFALAWLLRIGGRLPSAGRDAGQPRRAHALLQELQPNSETKRDKSAATCRGPGQMTGGLQTSAGGHTAIAFRTASRCHPRGRDEGAPEGPFVLLPWYFCCSAGVLRRPMADQPVFRSVWICFTIDGVMASVPPKITTAARRYVAFGAVVAWSIPGPFAPACLRNAVT
jgi:hypothetical protein